MTRTFATIATVAALTAGTAFADAHSPSMGEGFDMLQTALMSDFEQMGIPTDTLDNLTLGQIAAIKTIVESDEEDNQKQRIEAIIANN
ncbi:hypothetical protein MWU52_17895 [Jannaschia sp. S6380]|uniref:hypothetical protein n=1 Tax=Jannaschia sp. S6380 TaxID=2926408 RepID=UPI001FF3140A|nr:hypothetical protein [Jannaschia sp. S6380]MCK0169429.1 hypothetical protein [Jannaschia sp. S6380]